MSQNRESDTVEFADASPAVKALLQQGVELYRRDRAAAEAQFRRALAFDPSALSSYFCLYKIHAYGGRNDEALEVAAAGLAEAARQAGLSPDWRTWSAPALAAAAPGPARFAVYTLKAMAFVDLRRGAVGPARERLDKLGELGGIVDVGGAFVADLARAVG